MEEWNVCFSERLLSDVRARIIRCKAQMVSFDFFFALHLGKRFYSHTDNLFKVVRVLRWLLSVDSGQLLANLTKKICANQSFDHFYANVAHKP